MLITKAHHKRNEWKISFPSCIILIFVIYHDGISQGFSGSKDSTTYPPPFHYFKQSSNQCQHSMLVYWAVLQYLRNTMLKDWHLFVKLSMVLFLMRGLNLDQSYHIKLQVDSYMGQIEASHLPVKLEISSELTLVWQWSCNKFNITKITSVGKVKHPDIVMGIKGRLCIWKDKNSLKIKNS